MQSVINTIVFISGWLWGWPIISLLFIASVFLSLRLKFIQFTKFSYITKQTLGKIFQKAEGEGTISSFQALTAAIACVVGAGNIAGVPVAIMLGGPGAVFWMWIVAILGMALKYSEIALAVKYRIKNEKGEFVGGPVYYMENGLHNKTLAIVFALGLAFEVLISTMVQSNSLAASVKSSLNINPFISGIIIMVLTGIVVIGGIKSIARFTEKFVPFMATFYVLLSLIIILMNIDQFLNVILLIFKYAFKPSAALGGIVGATLSSAIRNGFARGLYSNEAGLGTSPIAHATAITDHPVRQAFWGIVEVFLDTIVICSCTAFVILSTNVWMLPNAPEIAGGLTTEAFNAAFGSIGGIFITISLIMFVFSTLVTLIYYGEKQIEYLFGIKASICIRWVYVLFLPVGAIGGAAFLWQFLDLALAIILIPNVIALMLLHKEIAELTHEFFTSPKYYLKDISGK